jgi:hypothetical protein
MLFLFVLVPMYLIVVVTLIVLGVAHRRRRREQRWQVDESQPRHWAKTR